MRQVMAALVLAGSLAVALAAPAALAAPVTEKQAKKLLFKGAKFTVELVEGVALDDSTATQVQSLVAALQNAQIARQFAVYGYYGAIAVMPGQPISEKSMAISAKLHSPDAARAAALVGCNALAGPDCVVVALILPKRYKPRDFSLSMAATNSFRDGWKDGNGPKYLAYSPSTDAWVIAKGAGAEAAALERCNEKAAANGVRDCVIGIAEP